MKPLIVILAVLALAACSSDGSGAVRPTTPEVVTASAAATHAPSYSDSFVYDVQTLLPGRDRAALLRIAHTACSSFPTYTKVDGDAAARAIAARQEISEDDAETVLNDITSFICRRTVVYGEDPTVSPKPRPTRKPKPQKITLKVYGNGSESGVITYSEDTDIEQATDASLPWKKQVDPNADFYQLSAQDGDGTTITCEIIDTDGTVLDKKTSTGPYAIASCSTDG